METMKSHWEAVLWAQLDSMPPEDRIKISGDWIVHLTQTLLPDLALYRREEVAKLMEHPEWNPQRLAETIGSRTVAINRLAREGRRSLNENSEAGTP